MFRDDIKRTIGVVLKANGYKMTNLGRGCIYYMKRFSAELESPYYMNKKIPHYRQEREIYRLISCDKQISQEFQSLKSEMSRMIRWGWEGRASQLAKDFAANLSETYFQNKGIDLAFDEIQEMFYQHLYAQCILDM